MIVEHWIRPARDGGVECFLRTADGRELRGRAHTVGTLRWTLEQCLQLLQSEPDGAHSDIGQPALEGLQGAIGTTFGGRVA